MFFKSQFKLLTVLIVTFIVSNSVLAHDVKSRDLLVEKMTQSSKSWNKNTLPAYPKGQPEVTILRITIAPHTKLDWHKHPVINAAVLLKGQLDVHTEDKKTQHLVAGDTLIEVVNTWHYGINNGDEAAELIVFYAGIKGSPLTIKK
ncbi:cupin domain-containing protein [Pseudoalteromonas denitrificans]|jgi:quercetin dioxygenase-like cupin family protein|uniref:Cupin domain-containing protein n=1 Tax=Pseudoalteromonas denitrificans DSM 6059 TaxID=1123010 RepID=A0A1I1U6E7_9GAMM|nr:cupin domain-containing protein [Pseudoalteromonas denitrificans]SFD63470.1 Cupin domain-containing protein [Pseudoalteromonas denitrificans DSM 6059]